MPANRGYQVIGMADQSASPESFPSNQLGKARGGLRCTIGFDLAVADLKAAVARLGR